MGNLLKSFEIAETSNALIRLTIMRTSYRSRFLIQIALMAALVVVVDLRADPDPSIAMDQMRATACQNGGSAIHKFFDYDRLAQQWFPGQEHSDHCKQGIAAFRKAVERWASMGANSPICRLKIDGRNGPYFDLRFPAMYSYLNGLWKWELVGGNWKVVSIPTPPNPPPYEEGCSF